MKELVDGTIRVQIDIEPQHRTAFLELFPAIDMPVALAPLNIGQAPAVPGDDDDIEPPYTGPVTFSKADLESKDIGSSTWTALGPLCKSAIMLGKEEAFQEWVCSQQETVVGEPIPRNDEEWAANYIRVSCGVESRKELDEVPEAKAAFKDMMRQYRGWLEQQR
jgi:hypothetical protein